MQTQADRCVWVVIAAYNEARVIGRVIADVQRHGYRVVVVDDGSTDATAEAAGQAGAQVVRHPVNLGQGAALQTGV
jgi:glycosyltransferase involved in cell wall biosynthesis